MQVKPDSRTSGLAAGDAAFSLLLDRRIAEMRRLLAAMRPHTTAEALKALRNAFPDTPLDEHLAAIEATRH